MINNKIKLSFIALFTIISFIFSKEPSDKLLDNNQSIYNNSNADCVGLCPSQSVININNMAYWMKKSSSGTTSGSPNGTQADYPIGTGGLVYEDGMLWGVKVKDGNTSDTVRVGGTTYYSGLKAGRAVYDANGDVCGSTDPKDHHVWRVRSDYKTADLTSDASNYLNKSNPTDADVSSVYDQYDYDWINWPASWGAPYDDVDEDGAYDHTIDIPGYPGADQTLWVVANDIPEIVNSECVVSDTSDTAPNVYGASAVGIELQVTMWAYKFGASDPLGNMIFKKASMKYTGLREGYNSFDPSIAKIDTAYFTQWADPDLGTYTDDYVGCDTDLSFGYVYNGNAIDGVFNGIYQLPVPAGGYDFLQGPINADGDTLGMTAFTYFGAGSSISDPDLSDYKGTLQFFNLMEGFLPRPEYPVQTPWTDLNTNTSTKFVLSGDPVSGSGWIDGVQLPPGDRRLVMASGPFAMDLGDSQDVVLALVGGMGSDNISSVSVAKFHDTYAQYAYDNSFSLPSAPASPVVQVNTLDGEILLDWGYDAASVFATEEVESKGFVFEGYNVYQLPSSGSPISEGKKIATFDKINVVQTIFDPGVDSKSGFIIDQAKQSGTNTGVQRYYRTDYDELRSRDMSNGITYHYAVTAYSYLADNQGSPFKSLESSPTIKSVMPNAEAPGFTLGSDAGGEIATVHTGTAGGSVGVSVVNPNDITGDNYAVTFDIQHYYLDDDGLWKFTDFADSVGTLERSDLTGSSISGVAVYANNAGTLDLKLTVDVVSPDYNYADGVRLTLPSGVIINSASEGSGAIECSVTGQEVLCGDNSLSEGGAFSGGQVITININTVSMPINLDYIIYDDGWATAFCAIADNAATCDAYGLSALNSGAGPNTQNAVGTTSVTEIGNDFKSIKHWNIVNTTADTLVLTDQVVMNGITLENITDGVYDSGGDNLGINANPIIDGLQFNVNVGYAAPTDAESRKVTGAGTYNIDSYAASGWSATAASSDADAYGKGLTTVDALQKDVRVIFDGVLGEPDANGFLPVVSGGSQVWLYGARGGDLANHPANTAGTSDAFLITVPFKIYDMEPDNGGEPVQISMILYDRIQAATSAYDGTYDGAADGTPAIHAFNPYDRMYSEFVLRPYEETLVDFESNEAFLTWNVVWWKTDWVTGDIVDFVYANPIQQGVDTWALSTVANTSSMDNITQNDIDLISVYPNPYYGLHALETSRSDKYVSFNHLPEKATIRIFSLGGTMVKEIRKNSTSQIATWDLKNQYEYPIASGIYIIHIDTDYGKKVLKLAVVQETQVLKYY